MYFENMFQFLVRGRYYDVAVTKLDFDGGGASNSTRTSLGRKKTVNYNDQDHGETFIYLSKYIYILSHSP